MKLFRSFATALAFTAAFATAQPATAQMTERQLGDVLALSFFAAIAGVIAGSTLNNNRGTTQRVPTRMPPSDDIVDLQVRYDLYGQPYYGIRQLSRAGVTCSDVGGRIGAVTTRNGVRRSACKLSEEAWRDDDPRDNRRTERGQCELPGIWMRVPKHGGGTERLCVIPMR